MTNTFKALDSCSFNYTNKHSCFIIPLCCPVKVARNLIMRGCEECPSSEDVWLEAARLSPPEQGKSIVAQAIIHLPQAVRLWVKAAELEILPKLKRVVYKKGTFEFSFRIQYLLIVIVSKMYYNSTTLDARTSAYYIPFRLFSGKVLNMLFSYIIYCS